ncbi:MAG: N-acetylmuramoyl-L-alanine amidase [Actinobacteria bacterium]|nr:N-acetylmuramoyl-L-alanine amidase [Actinomycetota bacterium]
MTIEQITIPKTNYMRGRAGYSPIWIVCHSIVGNLESAITSFKNPARQASSTYGISYNGDRVVQFVDESNTPYTNGNTSNYWSITIEHDDDGRPWDDRPDGLYSRSAELVRDIQSRHDIVLVNGHRDTGAPTACPAALDVGRIANEAGGISMISREEFEEWRGRLQKQLEETYPTKEELVLHGHDGAVPRRATSRPRGGTFEVPEIPTIKPKRTGLAKVRAGHGKGDLK